MGTAVIGGTLAASLLAIFLIPVTFYVVERIAGAKKRHLVFFASPARGLFSERPIRADTPDTAWFQAAKFGLFMHWGALPRWPANTWNGQAYYGSSEWLMNRAKIPAADLRPARGPVRPLKRSTRRAYARFAREAGARYLIITAKHHEGFAMFGSKASPFNIVDATPYHRDPMAALSAACRAEGVKFGFYYSQFLDWHEPDGGGNTWDFPGTHDYRSYYAAKSTPQVRELLSNSWSPRRGLVRHAGRIELGRKPRGSWPKCVQLRQPGCLVSSRVGQGLGDFRDLGDSEPPLPCRSRGHGKRCSPTTTRGAMRATTPTSNRHGNPAPAGRGLGFGGGNLLLNVGPDGQGRIPSSSLRYLREVGAWLAPLRR